MDCLFAYGTLMCPDIMQEVSGHDVRPVPAVLHNHQRLSIIGEDYPGIIHQHGSHVDGLLYSGINEPVWRRLDRFEGEQYRRMAVTVLLEDGTQTTAQTYLIHPSFQSLLSDQEWDFAAFLAHGKARFRRLYGGYPD